MTQMYTTVEADGVEILANLTNFTQNNPTRQNSDVLVGTFAKLEFFVQQICVLFLLYFVPKAVWLTWCSNKDFKSRPFYRSTFRYLAMHNLLLAAGQIAKSLFNTVVVSDIVNMKTIEKSSEDRLVTFVLLKELTAGLHRATTPLAAMVLLQQHAVEYPFPQSTSFLKWPHTTAICFFWTLVCLLSSGWGYVQARRGGLGVVLAIIYRESVYPAEDVVIPLVASLMFVYVRLTTEEEKQAPITPTKAFWPLFCFQGGTAIVNVVQWAGLNVSTSCETKSYFSSQTAIVCVLAFYGLAQRRRLRACFCARICCLVCTSSVESSVVPSDERPHQDVT